jgi:hypothetical protein
VTLMVAWVRSSKKKGAGNGAVYEVTGMDGADQFINFDQVTRMVRYPNKSTPRFTSMRKTR